MEELWSRPARGAWIEILEIGTVLVVAIGRAPQGARGLKSENTKHLEYHAGVAPRKGRVD